MHLFQNQAGINITNSKLQIVEIVYKDKNFYLENVDEEHFESLFDLSLKESKLIFILQNSFNQLIKRKTLNSLQVSFTLPHNFFKIIEIPYDKTLVKSDLNEQIKWELSILYPENDPDDFVTQFIEVDKSIHRKDNSLIIISLYKKHLEVIHKFCVRNNLSLKFVDYAHIASNAIIKLENPKLTEGTYLSFYITDSAISAMLSDGSHPIFLSVKKIDESFLLSKYYDDIVEKIETFDDAFGALRKVYVSGNNVSEQSVDELAMRFNVQVKIANPFNRIKINPMLYENPLFVERYNSFTAAAGIAMRMI